MWKKLSKRLCKAAGIFALLVLCGVAIGPILRFMRRHSPDPLSRLLEQANEKAWLNNWIDAAPLYREAEALCIQRNDQSCALYSRVSQIPANSETASIASQIALLSPDLTLPAARDYRTRLRILGVRGMLEVNYDAAMTSATYSEIEKMALRRGHFLIAARARGEQGIADFLTGNIATAKKKVVYAWTVSKLFHDRAAQIRYASMYAEGLAQIGRYQEAQRAVAEAIRTAHDTPHAPYPSMAESTKVEILTQTGKYAEAFKTLDESEAWALSHHLEGHLCAAEINRGDLWNRMGKTDLAIVSYRRALEYADHLSFWRGFTSTGGSLAKALASEGHLEEALQIIDRTLNANTHIPDELYFVPRNLAVKAEILRQMGRISESNDNYKRSTTLIDSLLTSSPTPGVERLLLADLSDVYSGYFVSLVQQSRNAEAFTIIENAHGRIETQSLEHHAAIAPHTPSSSEQRLTQLNIRLINSDDPAVRAEIEQRIYQTELEMDTPRLAGLTSIRPVALEDLQRHLEKGELLLEYVLGDQSSYVMAITQRSASSYSLPGKNDLETRAAQYRKAIGDKRTTSDLGDGLFQALLGVVPEYRKADSVIVVADGGLHLLPFSALWDGKEYVVQSHAVSVVPSATILDVVREGRRIPDSKEFVGVAAWTAEQPSGLKNVVREITAPELKQFVPLPQSLHEVTTIAQDFPKPSIVLSGDAATETEFKALPLSDYSVLHLALHGYVDKDYPDRSALVFAPERRGKNDGLLQAREIRNLQLNASLVTLSACDSGVGPVGESGVDNLASAFLDAGATTVVSAMWDVDDRATADLMIDFYQYLIHGRSKSEALRLAKLRMIASAASQPYYWAAFEMSGEPSAKLANVTEEATR
jgi:CHAT domain-containing protein